MVTYVVKINVACGIKLFTDDTKIYSTIKDNSDTLLLQKNLDMVNEWSHKWLLKFNVDKCKLLQLGNSSPANYTTYPVQMDFSDLLSVR